MNYKDFGQGEPLVILHGLFGMLDNWQTLGKKLAENHMVYLVDQRNHGRSPHVDSISYPEMAHDLKEFMESHWMHHAAVLGHSMGGKTAMQLALQHPDMVEKLVVVDISPVRYPGGHQAIFEALLGLEVEKVEDRSAIEGQLEKRISDWSIRQFLMKNLRKRKEGGYRWKMNLPVIYRDYERILAPLECDHPYEGPALFIRGGRSQYVQPEHEPRIRELFPAAEIRTVPDAGHWVHAEAPDRLLEMVKEFLS